MIYQVLGALMIAASAAFPAPSCARDDTIILRLENRQQTECSGQPNIETPRAIDVPGCGAPASPPPKITALSAVLMDADTGQVLYSKNPHLRLPNASTTKILTATLLIENCGMSQTVRASKKACETPFTSLNLRPGERMSVKDLLMGMMIRSANDAAVVAAEHMAGSTRRFAVMMNKRARQLGCTDTHFVTPNGLPAKGHYSSAHDLCLLARHALKLPVFNEIVSTRKHILSTRTINRKDLVVFVRSKFLKNYPGADGVKSGYLKEAGSCFVGSATRNAWRLVSAVLKSENAAQDTEALMDYAFGGFRSVVVAKADAVCAEAPVSGGSLGAVPAKPKQDLRVAVPKSGGRIVTTFKFAPLKAPVPEGIKVGTMTALVNGKEAMTVDLRSAEAVGVSIASKLWSWTKIGGLAMMCLIVGRRYGNAFAKGSRRRRRRVPATLRGFDRFR